VNGGTPRQPITGEHEPESKSALLETPPHVGFDKAWADAIDRAGRQWRSEDDPEESIEVTVELQARLDFWNPGGIGQYKVKITPAGGS
jgi:hypothetical protein